MIKVADNAKENLKLIHKNLAVENSFDIVERKFVIAGKQSLLYYLNGFIKDAIMEDMLKSFLKLTPEDLGQFKTADEFVMYKFPHVAVETQTDLTKAIDGLLCGQTIMYIDGFDAFFMVDLRVYPGRDSAEPEKEKTLRGSRDAFIEKLVFNAGYIRRRIRDPRLTFQIFQIGDMSKTDVCIAYIDGIADSKILQKIIDQLNSVNLNALTVGDQTLVDAICKKSSYSPFPKVRYTERPDVAAAHVVEGKFLLMVDNTPDMIILPTTIFDFTQDINDYYFPLVTGNYLRVIRNLTTLATILLIPLFLLIVRDGYKLPESWKFLLPSTEDCAIPVFWQFMILEFAIDSLKIASLTTPSPLGSSLSMISGLIIGEYTIKTGWFTPQAILYAAICAIAGYSQPSIEMTYAIKFSRIFFTIMANFFGMWGIIAGIVIVLIIMGCTKTIVGEPYFYPLIPFNWSKLSTLLFRKKTSKKVQEHK